MGSDFLETYKAVINYESKTVEFKINHKIITIPLEYKRQANQFTLKQFQQISRSNPWKPDR